YDYGSDSGFRARPNANNLNPVASALYDFNGTNRHELNGNFSFDIQLTEGLTFETRYGAQYFNSRAKDVRNPYYGGGNAPKGDMFAVDNEFLTQNFLQLLRYRNQFGDHSLEVFVAHESDDREQNVSTQYKGRAVSDRLYELNNYVVNLSLPTGLNQGRSFESYCGLINYDWLDKYYLTGSVSRDGSSRFVNEKWGTFGSVGAAWVVSNEDFLLNNDILSFLKLKASYGIMGDEAGVGFYSGYDTFDLGLLAGGIAITARDNGNPDLTWETSKMFQAGVELSLGRYLDVAVDYYKIGRA